MLAKLKSHWPVVFLLLVSLILCIVNYTPGTFLSGWDTLHPEFNFGLNFERTIFGVFRIEQGLGAVAAHSHMADLPRIILLYLSSFILPMSFLRYFYIFLNLIIGPLAMYFLLKHHFLKNDKASFLGALFYLLNLGTVQTFNVPFEMFTTLFATLPLMFYFATSYILEREKRTKNLLLFAISVIFNSPSAYASTLWFVLFLSFFTYFFLLSALNFKKGKHHLKHFFILTGVFLAINLYWLIPDIYFILTHGKEVAGANINKLFSEQAFLKNKEFGNIKDILFLKSFYFDWNIYSGNNNFTDLLGPFINHLKDIKVLFIGYLFGTSFIIGAIYCFRKLKEKSIPLFSVLLISLFFLVNDNFPLSYIFNFLQDHVPFFKEALRFPGDKILNIYVFLVTIFFGYFCLFIIEKLKKIKLTSLFTLAIFILIIYYCLPAFSGNFINPKMRINIPNSYFELFNYLKEKPENLRVANLPIQSQWGWVYYQWPDNKPSFQGAGFLYFGIKQPLLDRDFDRWSPFNESYYREMSYAIYKEDPKLLANVVKKYKIGIIFIDKSVISPQNPSKILYFEQSKTLIEKSGLFEKTKNFGDIEVFETKNNIPLIETLNTNINISPLNLTTYRDYPYELFGNYVSTIPLPIFSSAFFPFRDLIDNQSKVHRNVVSFENDKITLNPSGSVTSFNSSLLSETINLIPANLITQKSNNKLTVSFYPNTPVFDNLPSTVPIKIDINTSEKESILLSLNQNQLFNIGALSDNTPLSAGTALLKNGDNQIAVFNSLQNNPILDFENKISPYFLSCEENEITPNVGFDKNQITIKAKNDTCVILPLKYLPQTPNSSLLTNLKFEFLGNAKITTCLYDLKSLSCVYYKDPERLGNFVFLSYVLEGNKTNDFALKIFIQPQNILENKYILKNLSSSYSKSIDNFTITKTQIANLFINRTGVSFNKLYLQKSIIYDPGLDITSINNFENECNSSNSSVKKEIISENNKKVIRYFSAVGSFCNHFSYQNLPHNQGYLITITSKNKSGLPLSLCVSNYVSKRCDIYSDLSKFKEFNKDVYLLPPMDDAGYGYNISFENLGIIKSPSENFVAGIEIIPIPYEFIGSIYSQTKTENKFFGTINKITKYNPGLYVIDTSNNPSLLVLNYSFEPGFKAYYLNCNSNLTCFAKGLFAPFYAKKASNHVLVNAWANGWIIENDKCQMSNIKCQIAIVYLPQYFEYIGFALLILVFALLSFETLKHKKV